MTPRSLQALSNGFKYLPQLKELDLDLSINSL